MPKISAKSQMLLWVTALAALFSILLVAVDLNSLIILLNGVFAGAMAAIVVSFGALLLSAVRGDAPYDRVRQFAVSVFLQWAIINGGVWLSIFYRSVDIPVNLTSFTPFLRYLAIIAAAMQVTAPDFGLGIFHGRDRRVLWTGLLVGSAVALAVIFLQTDSPLAPLVKNAAILIFSSDSASAQAAGI
jgi:hypothetical protein